LLGIHEGDALLGEKDGIFEGKVLIGVTDAEGVGDVKGSGAVVTGATLDSVEVLGVSDAFVGILVGDVEGAVMIDGVVLDLSEGDELETLEGDKLADI
jgi:hypothetical protein